MRDYEAIESYFDGLVLIGDDYGPEQLARWYADEKEGYAQLGARNADQYEYQYHALNYHHCYRFLESQYFENVLGFGSAYGEELIPLLGQVGAITIVDPSDSFVNSHLRGVPVAYVRPSVDGVLPFRGAQFNLITCFGVLHHIPNVSFVVSELSRVLAPGGVIAIREPIVSMGDWRAPRAGLTRRERGIPLHLLIEALRRAGLSVARQSFCDFRLVPRVLNRICTHGAFNSKSATILDAWLSRAFAWNVRYHARTFPEKLRPTSAFLILSKE